MISEHELVLEGRIVDLDKIYESRIGIDNGTITEIDPQAKGKEIFHLEKELIFPGFIDTHGHARIPGGEHKEDFPHFSRAALNGGVTTALCMLNTDPPGTTPEVLQYVRRKASRESQIDIKFFALIVYGNPVDVKKRASKESRVDYENLFDLEPLAQYSIGYKAYLTGSTGGYLLPITHLQIALNKVCYVQKPITFHYVGRDLEEEVLCQLQIFDRVNIAHVATAENLKVIEEYKERGYTLVCELTPHHALLTNKAEKKLGSYAKMVPPLQTEEDRLALIDGLKRGSIDFLATDHAPHTREEKESSEPPSGVPGLDTYGNTVALLIKEYGISPQTMMRATSYNAAQFFGLKDVGRIEVGKKANITVLDLEHPETIDSINLYTKCGWSPFEGWTFPGRVVRTIYHGKTLMENGIMTL